MQNTSIEEGSRGQCLIDNSAHLVFLKSKETTKLNRRELADKPKIGTRSEKEQA